MNTLTRGGVGLVLLTILAGLGYALIDKGSYGLTIFVLFPVLLGGLTAWVVRPARGVQAAGWGALSVLAAMLLFLLLGAEGAICILMTAPLALPLGALGGWLAYRARSSRVATGGIAMLLLSPPGTFAWDATARPPVFQEQSTIEVAASPETVWKFVVQFPELADPQEWYFRVGLAYPMRARLEGSGPGATRYCDFSTGPFVETIEVSDAPRLLRFRIIENPAPMRELSFYSHVDPKHLHGYFISKAGQFELTQLPNGHTRIDGTSWYQHGLRPAEYWRWWSDAIIHRIHMRVLTHIKALAEADYVASR